MGRRIDGRNARSRGRKGLEAIRARREAKRLELWRQLVRGECLKRAAFNVGISYSTAKVFRREA